MISGWVPSPHQILIEVTFPHALFLFYFFFILLFSHLLTCVYIVWATSSLLPCYQAEPVPPSCSLILLKKNIRDNKKDIAFFSSLRWRQLYREIPRQLYRLLPCICVWQCTLVHLYQTSLLLHSPIPIVASASLRLLYSLLYNEHINHIQVLGFLSFPYSSCVRSPLSVW
jgi:hypothetical protein